MPPKDIERMANSVDPDQTALKEQSDQNLHCLLRHTSQYLKLLRYFDLPVNILILPELRLWASILFRSPGNAIS